MPIKTDPKNPGTHAMPSPSDAVISLDAALLEKVVAQSRSSERGRIILPCHKDSGEVYQRMLNAVQPGSYIQPHRHQSPPKAETVLTLKGSLCLVIFDDSGALVDHYHLATAGPVYGIDVAAGIYHTFYALEPDTVVFEAKTGPYNPVDDKDFAAWAPREESPETSSYLDKLYALTTLRPVS